jgi:hypothetical protein
MAEPLFLTLRAASEYMGCSKQELLSWVEPDRRLPGDVGRQSGARLWLRRTLDMAKPQIAEWRERDCAAARAVGAQVEAERSATSARRAGMRKGALVAAKVRAFLGCSLTELNRWAADGRLRPDGEIVLIGLLKKVNARAWLPETLPQQKRRGTTGAHKIRQRRFSNVAGCGRSHEARQRPADASGMADTQVGRELVLRHCSRAAQLGQRTDPASLR